MNDRSTPTMRWLMRARVGLLCVLAAPLVHAADGLDDRAERARIRTERAAAESNFLARERECRTRFAVTSCVNDARREQREIIARLHGEEEVLDDARRKQRAAQRAEAIRDKVRRDEARDREAANPEKREANRKATAPHVTVRSPEKAASEAHRPSRAASAPAIDRRADEARSEAAYDARAQAAQAHRDAVEKRNAERAAKRSKAVAPLPAGASAP